jgi:hypothetical protein
MMKKSRLSFEKTSVGENEYQPAEAGDGLKPGVERSETPG